MQLADIQIESQLKALELGNDDPDADGDSDYSDDDQKSMADSVKPLVSMHLEWNEHIKQVICCDRDSYMIFDDEGDAP